MTKEEWIAQAKWVFRLLDDEHIDDWRHSILDRVKEDDYDEDNPEEVHYWMEQHPGVSLWYHPRVERFVDACEKLKELKDTIPS